MDLQTDLQTEQSSIESARAFHLQLRQLIAAKIPVCLDPRDGGTSRQSMASLQSQFESHVANRGTLESYTSDSALPAAYRTALKEWLQGVPTEALHRLTSGAEGQRYFRRAVGFLLLQALLILGCLFLGMVCTCVWLLPKMEQIQQDSFVKPGPGLTMLAFLRDTMPYWGLLLPVAAFIAILFRRRFSQRLMARIAPIRQDSHALSEFQGIFSRPARFQWLVSLVVIACGVCVLLQALSVFGVTIELLMQLVSS